MIAYAEDILELMDRIANLISIIDWDRVTPFERKIMQKQIEEIANSLKIQKD